MWRRALRPRWMIAGILVILAVPVMVRLGFWQLDRLAQRREFNQRFLNQIDAPQMVLDTEALALDLYQMEFRHVRVTGQYDYDQQVILRNQVWNGQIGFQLLAPMVIEDQGAVVLVERGWIPVENDTPDSWDQYDQKGIITIDGILRRPGEVIGVGNFPVELDGDQRQTSWLAVDLEGLAAQSGYDLLPVYVQALPQSTDVTPPVPIGPEFEITEGPHLGYAFQWFGFAAIAAIGFPLFLYRELRNEEAGNRIPKMHGELIDEE